MVMVIQSPMSGEQQYYLVYCNIAVYLSWNIEWVKILCWYDFCLDDQSIWKHDQTPTDNYFINFLAACNILFVKVTLCACCLYVCDHACNLRSPK